MRRKDFIQKNVASARIIKADYLSVVKEKWSKYGYDPDMYLDENNDLYNILEEFIPTKEELKRDSFSRKYECAAWQVKEDYRSYKQATDFARNNFCGFYDVKEKRYVRPEEIPDFADYYLIAVYYSSAQKIKDKFYEIFDALAAHFIASDVIDFLESKSMYRKPISLKNIDKFNRYGPHAGEIFDPEEMCYRKPKNFEEYTHYLHTNYWFHDPSKGYRPEARYKWNPNIPDLLNR